MLAVSHPDATTMMKTHPSRSTRNSRCEVKQCPIGDSIRSVQHSFRLSIWTCHGTCIEMVPANHDGSGHSALSNHLVEEKACPIAFTIAKPADTRRKPLEGNLLRCEPKPFLEPDVLRKQLQQRLVGLCDIRWVTRERNPPKWSSALTERIANERRHEARIGKRVAYPGKLCFRPN